MAAPHFVLCLALCLSIGLSTSLSVGLSTESRKADDGYEVFPEYSGSRYKLSTYRLDWAHAVGACQGDGGDSHLLVVNTDAEAGVVRQMMARFINTGNPEAHVGIDDIATEGTWLTVQGRPVTDSGYNMWVAGQPDGGTAENCGYVQLDALYYDGKCSAVRPFICEKPNNATRFHRLG